MAEETKPAAEGTPSWLLGVGLDTDMTGDVRPGAGASLRFWLTKGSDRHIIFLTEGNKAPTIWEHQVYMGGKWQNWFTCLSMIGLPCPLCKWADENDGKFTRSKVMFFTVIDTHEFEDRAGKKRKDVKRLMGCKKDTAEILKRKYLKRLEAEQGLRGAMYEVYRPNSDKSASVGEAFEFVTMIDLSVLPDSADFDYTEMLKPNPEKVKACIERLKREAGGVSGGKEGTDAKVVF